MNLTVLGKKSLAKYFLTKLFWHKRENWHFFFCQKLKIGTTSKLAKTRKLHFWATCFDLLTFWTPSAHTKYKHYSWLRGVLMGIWLKATRKSVTNISIRLFFYYIDFTSIFKVSRKFSKLIVLLDENSMTLLKSH